MQGSLKAVDLAKKSFEASLKTLADESLPEKDRKVIEGDLSTFGKQLINASDKLEVNALANPQISVLQYRVKGSKNLGIVFLLWYVSI